MSDVVLHKKVSVERCLRQVGEYYRMDTGLALEHDHLRQDGHPFHQDLARRHAAEPASISPTIRSEST
ncbi:MAG: hypothetical protein IPN63_13550 [Gammaproteobacteria bacterium]|nr:hypothetical protein [Gammaproteobacteria bacterium]